MTVASGGECEWVEKEVLNGVVPSALDLNFRTSFALRRDATATYRSGISFACALIKSALLITDH